MEQYGKPSPVPDVPELTARVARSDFPEGNSYRRLCDALGAVSRDEDLADLYHSGHNGVPST